MAVEREELLGAAERVFEEWGYRRASMEDVARAAGVSRAGLYKHFGSKEALFRELLERLHGGTLERAEEGARTSAGAPLAERLCGLFAARQGALVDRVRDRLHGPELVEMAARVGGDLHAEAGARFLRIVARVLREADAAGEIDLEAAGVSARAAAELMTRAVDGLKSHGLAPLDAKAFHDRLPALVGLLVHGLGERPAD